ncbi:MAG: dihydrodipicolinate synthase family protein [Pseudomonadota bacterium]
MNKQTLPRLWCPPLTHYNAQGGIDAARMRAHWQHMAPYCNAFLVPGSTGDGWEMSDVEINGLLKLAFEIAADLESTLLLGALKSDAVKTQKRIEQMRGLISAAAGDSSVAGFVICAPHGAERTEAEMEDAFRTILSMQLPIGLYQLPQVTGNRFSTPLVARLAGEFSNLRFIKDTSGEDSIANGLDNSQGLFLVRGAELDYKKWLREAGGPYDGFLLSTANCFAKQLLEIIAKQHDGDLQGAASLSDTLTDLATAAFGVVAELEDGNPFANANKAIDHFMAFGADADLSEGPRLHAGSRLSAEILARVREILDKAGHLPRQGYLT